ncbi:MFS transporter [Nonomuraea sp. N2-4H]|uniref:MFS transporter n=1 Tax=Nonomuraea sp. N2-4H TaxID=3128898 RepID=UPI00324E03A7
MNKSAIVARRARVGVFGFFFLAGLVMGVWAAGLPSLNDRLDLGPALLGRVLLLISGGALASMLLAGRLVDRWGSRRLCWIAGPLSGVALLGPALAPSPWVLMVLAVVFGMGLGVLEIAMNAHSVEVERCYGRPIISAFHGTWSLGGAAGGGLTSLVLQGGLDAQGLLVVAAIVVPFLYLPAARLLLPDAYTRPGPAGEAAVDAGGGVTGAAAGPGEGSAGSGGLSAPGEVPGESAGSAAGLGEGVGESAGTTAGLGEGVGESAGTTAGLGQEAEKPAGVPQGRAMAPGNLPGPASSLAKGLGSRAGAGVMAGSSGG